jgi:hypothetical protein
LEAVRYTAVAVRTPVRAGDEALPAPIQVLQVSIQVMFLLLSGPLAMARSA